jgi:hypothetical protein
MKDIAPVRFAIGLTVVIFTVYLVDQYSPDLSNVYISVLIALMLLVYSDQVAAFLSSILGG